MKRQRPAETPDPTRPRHNPQQVANNSSDTRQTSEPPTPLLTPHTLRLLTLIQEGSRDHASLAALQLTTITSQSSPVVLWEVLGRLLSFLTANEWRTRANASAAMQGVARHLPVSNQQDFLRHSLSTTSHGERQFLWLRLEDLTDQENAGLFAIMKQGRLLLARGDDDDEHSNLHAQEEHSLQRLDTQQLSLQEGTGDDNTDEGAHDATNEFVQRRVQFQRRILAQRLGLAGVLQATRTTADSMLSGAITQADYVPLQLPDHQQATSAIKRRRNKPSKESPEKESPSCTTLRALLVMEMKRHQEHDDALSHHNPQTLLATELLYRMLDPSWQVRHGAILGILSLLRAWNNAVIVPSSSRVFGAWPDDILARCVCVLVLDRFGDYSGTMISSSSSSLPFSGMEHSASRSGGVVAPIRETAAQLLAVLVRMAPPAKQGHVIQLLMRLATPDFFTAANARRDVEADDYWEISHGALLALKYIVVVTVSHQTLPTEFAQIDFTASQVLVDSMTDIATVAITCLSNDSEDVQGVAAHILVQLVTCSLDKREHILRDQEALSRRAFQATWKALESIRCFSSCTVDLMNLCTTLLRVNNFIALEENASSTSSPDEMEQPKETRSRVLDKLREFLDHDLPSVRLSAVQSIAIVVEPMIPFRDACDSPTGSIADVSLRVCKTRISVGARMAASIAGVVERLFDSFFSVPETSNIGNQEKHNISSYVDQSVNDEFVSCRDVAWKKLIVAVKASAEENKNFACMVESLKLSLMLSYFGLVIPRAVCTTGGTTTEVRRLYHLGDGGSSPSKNDVLFQRHLCASKALAGFLFGVDRNYDVDYGSLSEEEKLPVTLTADLLELSICSFVQSPWLEQCEAACLLFRALASLCTCNNTTSTGCTTFCGALKTCRKSLCALLTSHTVLPFSLEVFQIEAAHKVLHDPVVARLCDSSFVGSAFMVKGTASGEGGHALALNVVEMCKRTIEARLNLTTTNHDVFSTVPAMRVFATMAGAVISIHHSQKGRFLESLAPNKKISPLVRPIMTSLKNEAQTCRQAESCTYLVNLLELMTMETDLMEDSPFARAREKILSNLCDVVASGCSNNPITASTPEYFAFARVLQSLTGNLQPRQSSFQCIEPLWKILNPLLCSESNTLAGNSSQQLVSKSLNLLKVVSGDLRRDQLLTSNTIDMFLPSVVRLACLELENYLRIRSCEIIKAFARIDAQAMLSVALPALLPILGDRQHDSDRLASCRMLQMLIEDVGMEVCPFVRHLLRIVMSLMADSVQECSSIANNMFASLVRVAPLIRPDESTTFWGTNIQAAEGPCDKDADAVVDHLIHGKPLPPFDLPDVIKNSLARSGVTLRPYQADGIAWLSFLQSVRLNGALCDSMGLGKTLQALIGVSISHCDANNELEPRSLVVCPSSVLGHWESEIERYFPEKSIFRSLTFIGGTDERKQLWNGSFDSCNIVITSYSVMRSEIDRLSKVLWRFCILDEGHLLKNPKTATARASRRIRSHHKLILTGTPVQNRVNELWATFDFLMPNFLGNSMSFAKEFAKPITKGNLPGASAESISLGMEKLKVLHQQVLPFILRREKTQVLKELPPKCITTIRCEMSPQQRSLYEEFCNSNDAKASLAALQHALQQGVASNHTQGADIDVGQAALKSLLFLRLLCTHPCLVEQKMHRVSSSARPCNLDLSGKFLALNELLRACGIHRDEIIGADNDTSLLFCKNDDDEDESRSYTSDLLESADSVLNANAIPSTNEGDSKCLIFAQFTQSLDALEELLFKPHMPTLRYVRLDGRVPANKRTALVDKFNRDPTVKLMLLTTRVGSLGLNLQAADTVVFLENDYNPFVDLQAMDRAHRIGQEKKVFVYRLVTKDSIEEKVMKLQERKMAMSKAIVNSENSTMFSMGTDRLLDIFTCRSDSHAQFADQKQRSDKPVSSSTQRDFDLDGLLERYKDDYVSLSVSDFIESFQR